MNHKSYFSKPWLIGMLAVTPILVVLWVAIVVLWKRVDVLIILSYVFCLLFVRMIDGLASILNTFFTRTVLTDRFIAIRSGLGKLRIKILLDEIYEIGISGSQEKFKLPKCIYFAKRPLKDAERKDLLLTGANGTIQFLDYDQRIIDFLKNRLGLSIIE